jgi:hypothetical protein
MCSLACWLGTCFTISSLYSVTTLLCVLGLLVAHHQEVTMYICKNWYVMDVLVDSIKWRQIMHQVCYITHIFHYILVQYPLVWEETVLFSEVHSGASQISSSWSIIHFSVKNQKKHYLNMYMSHRCWHRIHSPCRGLDSWSTHLYPDSPSLCPWPSQDCTRNTLQHTAHNICYSEYYSVAVLSLNNKTKISHGQTHKLKYRLIKLDCFWWMANYTVANCTMANCTMN